MFKWAQQTLANVVGTEEPVYGPAAIKSVAVEAKDTPYTETARGDFKFHALDSTSVETQVFYLLSDSGQMGLVQVIYSNVAGIRVTSQFNTKIFSKDASKPHLWCAAPLHNQEFSEDMSSFYATDCAVEMSEDGKSYSIKSLNDPQAIVNLKITQVTPGWHAGKTGNTLFGTDLENPWGTMRHAFWPRCKVEGSITTQDGPIDFAGQGLYIRALQGMKPHHAAAKWNFLNFQGPTYSAVLMDYTTPPSYGSTNVVVGSVVKEGEIIVAGCDATVVQVESKEDEANGWKEPTKMKYTWAGTTKDGKKVTASLDVDLEERLDRVDIMAEVPGFVKTLVSAAAGTKPYIYQFSPRNAKPVLKLKIGDEPEITETGVMFAEATFISG